jgi:colanic acid biosynthesis glycosyl transferase WcaI
MVRLAIVNLFYPPDPAPTANLAASLAEHRASLGDDVTVICGTGSYAGDRPAAGWAPRELRERAGAAPRVIRLWTPALGRASTLRRLGDYLTFHVVAAARLAAMPRQDAVVALTSPPYIVTTAVLHRLVRGQTRVILWSQDVYPDAAEEYGTIRPDGTASRGLRAANRWLFRHVDHVVALDRAMLDRQLSQYARDGRPPGSVIPNSEPLALFPGSGRPAPWQVYEDLDLSKRFVVLYLGNLGYGHPIETMVEAAARMSGDDAVFLFVGGGVRYPELEAEAERRSLDDVVLRGYVPKEETPAVLAGAACSLISLDDGSLGIMSPCKLHGSLAMGLPVLYVGPAGTNVDEAISAYRCGFSLRQGEVDGLVSAIRRLRDDPELAAELSRNARRAFEDAYSDQRTLPQFDALLDDLVGGRSGSASPRARGGHAHEVPDGGLDPERGSATPRP